MDLDKIRLEIDEVNSDLVDVFIKRMDLVCEVINYKKQNDIKILDKNREYQIIKDMTKKADSRYEEYIEEFIKSTMAISRKMQHDILNENKITKTEEIKYDENQPSVAYLGMPGSFSELAVIEYFKDDVNMCNISSFEEIIKGVEDSIYDMAMIPVENSSTGSVNNAVDLLIKHDINIIGEHVVAVHHFLLAQKGCDITDIKSVMSHPQALEQCKKFIDANKLLAIPCQSTASAAKYISESNDITISAIASTRAAKIYDLDIIKKDIQTSNMNFTRFAVITKKAAFNRDANKISLICTIEHEPGSLHNLIEIFSKYKINLLQLFSRPINDMPWSYRFHLDFEGNLNNENVICAIDEASKYCIEFKILGNYVSWRKLK